MILHKLAIRICVIGKSHEESDANAYTPTRLTL